MEKQVCFTDKYTILGEESYRAWHYSAVSLLMGSFKDLCYLYANRSDGFVTVLCRDNLPIL